MALVNVEIGLALCYYRYDGGTHFMVKEKMMIVSSLYIYKHKNLTHLSDIVYVSGV